LYHISSILIHVIFIEYLYHISSILIHIISIEC
jgi:hypothetical protein